MSLRLFHVRVVIRETNQSNLEAELELPIVRGAGLAPERIAEWLKIAAEGAAAAAILEWLQRQGLELMRCPACGGLIPDGHAHVWGDQQRCKVMAVGELSTTATPPPAHVGHPEAPRAPTVGAGDGLCPNCGALIPAGVNHIWSGDLGSGPCIGERRRR